MPKKTNYQFIYNEDSRFLVCPACKAMVTSADVEMFPVCPYCGKIFERTPDFEDFIIEDLARHWQHSCFGIGKGR